MAGPLAGIGSQIPVNAGVQANNQNSQVREREERPVDQNSGRVQPSGTAPAQAQETETRQERQAFQREEDEARRQADRQQAANGNTAQRRGSVVDLTV